MKLYTFSIAILVSCFLPIGVWAEQPKLNVLVKQVESDDGSIALAFYRDKESWLNEDRAFLKERVDAQIGEVNIALSALPKGDYAIAIYHDENNNSALDTNFIGIPSEGVGASLDAPANFGPPSFEDAVFNFKNSSTTVIHLNY